MILINEILRKIGAKVLQIPESEVNAETSKSNTPEWDSLNHLMILTEMEKHFKTKFAAADIIKIKSMADIESALKSKGIL